jgi:hypothetical protein
MCALTRSRGGGLTFRVTVGTLFALLVPSTAPLNPSRIARATQCQDFGCVTVVLRYDGGRRMRFDIHAHTFRRGTIVADGQIYDGNNNLYLDLFDKTCGNSTECRYSGHFNYASRCDGQVFELIGTGHRREDPRTDVVQESDTELAPLQATTSATQSECQR